MSQPSVEAQVKLRKGIGLGLDLMAAEGVLVQKDVQEYAFEWWPAL